MQRSLSQITQHQKFKSMLALKQASGVLFLAQYRIIAPFDGVLGWTAGGLILALKSFSIADSIRYTSHNPGLS